MTQQDRNCPTPAVRLLRIVCFSTAFLAMPAAHAVWDNVPDVRMFVEANDNVRLQDSDPLLPEVDADTSRTVLDARFQLTNLGQRGMLFAEPRVRADAYGEAREQELESEEVFFVTRGEYQWQAATAGFRGDFSKENILSSELEDAVPIDPDLDDPVDTSSGQLDRITEDRYRSIFLPFVEVGLTDRSSLLIEARYLDVTYTGDLPSERSDIRDTMLAAGIVRRVDERNQVTARLLVSHFEADGNQNNTDTVGMEGSFMRPLSESWSLNLAFGLQRSDFTFVDDRGQLIDNADANYVLDLALRNRTPRNTVNFNFRRTVNPSSSGFLVERDEIRALFRRDLTQRLVGDIALRVIDQTTIKNIRRGNAREYSRVELGIEWGFAPRWFIDTYYRYTFQDFEFEPGDAESNAFGIGINYRGMSRQQLAAGP